MYDPAGSACYDSTTTSTVAGSIVIRQQRVVDYFTARLDFAVTLVRNNPNLRPDFAVTPAMLDTFYDMLNAEERRRRQHVYDATVTKAAELLARARPTRELFDLAGVDAVVVSGHVFLPDADASKPSTSRRSAAADLAVVQHGSMTASRAVHQATPLPNGELLVTGGCSAQGCTAPQAGVEVYDPAVRMFRSSAPLLVERVGHAAAVLADGRVLAVGGGRRTGARQPAPRSVIRTQVNGAWWATWLIPAAVRRCRRCRTG
jgi:hypothetical protein